MAEARLSNGSVATTLEWHGCPRTVSPVYRPLDMKNEGNRRTLTRVRSAVCCASPNSDSGTAFVVCISGASWRFAQSI